MNILETAIEKGELNKKEIKLNGFLTYNFTEEEIEEILIRELKQAKEVGVYIGEKDYLEE